MTRDTLLDNLYCLFDKRCVIERVHMRKVDQQIAENREKSKKLEMECNGNHKAGRVFTVAGSSTQIVFCKHCGIGMGYYQ